MNIRAVPTSERAILQGIVRDEIALMLDEGGGRPRDVARRVCAGHPDLISRLGSSLAEEAITSIARKEFKKWTAVGEEKHRQLPLPSMASHLLADLPASISVPPVDADEDADPIYRPLTGPSAATLSELRRATKSLWEAITADRRKAKALTELINIMVSAGASDDSRVDVVLTRLSTGGEAQ